MKKYRTQIIFLLFILITWEIIYQLKIFPTLMFPSLQDIICAFIDGFINDNLFSIVLYSMKLILIGLGVGIILAFLFSSISIINKPFLSIYNMIISICDLIPGVALIPIALLWFGVGEATILAIVIHSIIWPLSRSIIDGFQSIPKIYIENAQNMELSVSRLIIDIYLPASFHHILSGLKVGWARAWRGLISAEMIFGATSSGSGIGWYIFVKRTTMDTASVYAALILIIIIGFLVEHYVFFTIEKHTVKKWGI